MSGLLLPDRPARTSWLAVTIATAVLAAGCGGTRVSDAEIERAANLSAPIASSGAAATPAWTAPLATATTTGSAAADASEATRRATGAATTSSRSGDADVPAAGSTRTDTAAQTLAQAAAPATAPATKSPVRLGVVGTFSGPVGGLVKDIVTGIRVWGQHVNATGGVSGHPVEVLVGDDGGDPARFNSIAQQFVEHKGVLAFLFTTVGFAPNGNNRYLDSKRIFTFGTEGGLEAPYTNPFILTASPSGLANAESMLLALAEAMKTTGKRKLAAFACSDFGICDNFDRMWNDPKLLARTGFEVVARGRPSLTQPDYTSQCLAAKQAGAEVVILGLDTASIRRLANDCARQNYRPVLATSDGLATPELPGDENVTGMVIGTRMAPFTDLRVPGIRAAHAAFARFAPGSAFSGGHAIGWLTGEFFRAAAANLPDSPTVADLEDGVYRIKRNDLDGMTFPITMTRGAPMPRQICYGAVVISERKYVTLPGRSLHC